MSKDSNCRCNKQNKHNTTSDCACGCSGAEKSAVNNQWASPASVKSSVYDNCKCNKKQEKTATNNQWC